MKLNHTQLGQGEPVILIHGLFGSLSNLGVLARALSDHYLVYSVDLRNHGQSAHAEQMGYPCLAADVVELIDDRGIAGAALVGHSMGGKTGMQVALDHPQRVRALVVGDIAPVTYPSHHEAVIAGLNAVAALRPGSRAQADDQLAEYVAEPGVRAFLLKNLVKTESGVFGLRVNLSAIERHYDEIAAAPQGNPFPGPTLFIKGSRSDYVRAKHKEAILHLFPNAQLKVLQNTGHWLHADKPALFNRTVLRFLDEVMPR
jgi:esterase